MKRKKLKISIITTTYNSAKEIKNVLESIKFQKYKNIEHIIIDSKSTDKTLNIVKNYKKFFNIKIIKKNVQYMKVLILVSKILLVKF